jgi:hypothetical protein
MHNAVQAALNRIKFNIPREILELAFSGVNGKFNPFAAPPNIDNAIINNVLKAKVFPDCNLMGGKTVQFSLLQSWWEKTSFTQTDFHTANGYYGIYRVPLSVTDGRPIVEINHVQSPAPYSIDPSMRNVAQSCLVAGAVNNVTNSYTAGDVSRRPVAELLQGNIIRIHPGGMEHVDWVVTCRVAYDENMSNLNSSAIDSFADLALLATRIYIYNYLVIKIDRGYIENGAELTSIKNIVEQWGSLEDAYKTRLNDYFGGNVMDIQRVGTFLKLML